MATTEVFGHFPPLQVSAVVCQAIIKKYSWRWGGAWEWKLLPARSAGRMWGAEAGQQSYQAVAMGQTQPTLSSLWERQISFSPLHIIKMDVMCVGMYNLNCIYDGEWEIAKRFTVKSRLWSCNAIFMLIINDIACCILGKECRFYTTAFVIKIIIPRQVQAKTANIFMNNAELCLSCVCLYKSFH